MSTYNGYTLCWTIHQGFYDVQMLQKIANDCAIPTTVSKEIKGLSLDTAYSTVCKFPSKGKPSVNPNKGQTSWYATHQTGEYYVLSRLTIDADNQDTNHAKKPKPTLEHIGNIYLAGYSIAFDPEYSGYAPHQKEVDALLVDMQNDLDQRLGKMSDVFIRLSMIAWIKERYAIPLRLSGGIYYLPDTAGLDVDILSLQSWFEKTGIGSVFALPVQRNVMSLDAMDVLKRVHTQCNLSPEVLAALRVALQEAIPQQIKREIVEKIIEKTVEVDIVKAATDAIAMEIAEINQSINDREEKRKLGDSPQIAGSREYSALTYVDALKRVEEKIGVLQENLGDKIGLERSKLEIVMNRAKTMADEARRIVNLSASAKEVTSPTYHRNGATTNSGKKTGTVKSRKSVAV